MREQKGEGKGYAPSVRVFHPPLMGERERLPRSSRPEGKRASEKRPPGLSWDASFSLLSKLFPFKDLTSTRFKRLPCNDDQLYYFEGQLDDELVRKPFALKISNGNFGQAMVSGQNAVMLHLKAKGIQCCEPIMTKRGRYLEILSEADLLQGNGRDDVTYVVRVLTYVPGELMDEVNKCYLTPELSYSVGGFVGRIDLALQDFDHEVVASNVLHCWDLQYFKSLKEYIPHIRDEQKREKVYAIMAAYEAHILPRLPSMKRGVVHGDMNGLNIILQKVGEKYEIAGVIDFGDCVQTCYLSELAIMLAHGMMGKKNPVEFVAPMLRGYLDAFPMDREDLNCLYYAVLARLSAIAVIVEYNLSLEPCRNMHIPSFIPLAYNTMDQLLAMSKEEVEKAWKLDFGNPQ